MGDVKRRLSEEGKDETGGVLIVKCGRCEEVKGKKERTRHVFQEMPRAPCRSPPVTSHKPQLSQTDEE